MVDVSKQIEAVTRALRTEDVDGEETRIQILAQEYPASIEDVWDAATTAERIARWFLPITGELRLGGRYQLEGNAGGEVLECAPPSNGTAEYRVTWEFGGGMSWVTVRLTDEGPERTRFELEHAARVADVPADMWDTFGPGATGVGWDGGLLGLSLHLGAVDGSLAPEEAEAWAVTDEGKAFYRAAADGWGKAHIAAGADREAATRAADATYGFYTGEMPGA
ncbi:SRPBCC domain-containing protein [Leucobacter celer]|uniref:SRPBCC domain-containing protein n=1 Tax=Leucobacter celer TaxID=668625 RepID=UPI0006A78B58|nr:SRPBCC domain-containing protein [Leucobacter celer]